MPLALGHVLPSMRSWSQQFTRMCSLMDAQIGRPDYKSAVEYLLQRAASLQQLASGRRDIAVEVPFTIQPMACQSSSLHMHQTSSQVALLPQVALERATGAVDMRFMHADITNAYINVSNVVLKITPAHAADTPAILVNGHFDSTLGSPGVLQLHACAQCYALAHHPAWTVGLLDMLPCLHDGCSNVSSVHDRCIGLRELRGNSSGAGAPAGGGWPDQARCASGVPAERRRGGIPAGLACLYLSEPLQQGSWRICQHVRGPASPSS